MRPRVVAVVGSLQARSSNKALVEAFGGLLSGATHFVSSGALHVLPPFNSDFESENVPDAVMAWRATAAVVMCGLSASWKVYLLKSFTSLMVSDWLIDT